MADTVLVGRIIKCESHRNLVDFGDFIEYCKARKKIKINSNINEIMVGDFVTAFFDSGEWVIESVEKRKNFLVRPYLANLDQIIITVAPIPQADYLLLDKLIINCHKQNLDIVLCLNKSDILPVNFLEEVRQQYSSVVKDIITVSAFNDDVESLLPLLRGKLSCFAGQSAVGKSSIINTLLKANMQLIGDISERSLKGKNTTTSAQIFKLIFCNDDVSSLIVDTPGFTMLDIHDIPSSELDLYYPEYVELSPKCKYRRCSHIAEPNCAVKDAVESGTLSQARYGRYVLMSRELKDVKKYERKEY